MSDPRAQALRLLGKWSALSRGHVALAAGCSCGVGVSNVRVADFEEQILDYLRTRHAASARARELLKESGGLDALLRALAQATRRDKAVAQLLADIERTVASFEEQHSGR
ncbi:MAG TPA: hypothetical protein VF211_10935 [Burkholderiales bacterium]